MNLLKTAEEYAVATHKKVGQTYGNDPYDFHLRAVVEVAKRYLHLYIDPKYHDEVLAACWCHDIMEDTGESYNDVAKMLGCNVADYVITVTDEIGKNRKEKALRTYLKIMNSYQGTFIKLCDRIANSTNSKNNKHSMFNKYKKEHTLFEYALKKNGEFIEMWDCLNKLFNEETK